MSRKTKCYIVNSKDLFDKNKNPGLVLSPEKLSRIRR